MNHEPTFPTPLPTPELIKVVTIGQAGKAALDAMRPHLPQGIATLYASDEPFNFEKRDASVQLWLPHSTSESEQYLQQMEEAQEDWASQLLEFIGSEPCFVLLIAGTGGHTSGIAAAKVGEWFKRQRITETINAHSLLLGIAYAPFRFEGDARLLRSREQVRMMHDGMDALLVVENDRLRHRADWHIAQAFGEADGVPLQAVQCLGALLDCTAVSVDMADIETCLKSGGEMYLGIGTGTGDHRCQQALDAALESPLLRWPAPVGASRILLAFHTSKVHEMEMDEMFEATNRIAEIAPKANILWGLTTDDCESDQLSISVLALRDRTE